MKNNITNLLSDQPWGIGKKNIFRFCFIFFALHILPFPLNAIPYLAEKISEPLTNLWNIGVNWCGKIFFNIPAITIKPNGSGDTTWNWVYEFLIVLLSTLGCLVWSLIDRKRLNYTTLNYWNNVWIRFWLGFILLNYGWAKIFPSQFGTITSYRLHQALGDMSPMGLLWTFMAYSPSYQFFAGLMECIGGYLLFFKRTTLLGALISFGVMLNVFVLNMCYDVPVKLFSFCLILTALYLASPDFGRLWNFFFLQKPTTAPPQYAHIWTTKKGYRIGRIVLKVLFIIGFTANFVYGGLNNEAVRFAPLTALYGRYTVTKHIKNNVEMLPNDSLRWENFFIDRRGYYNMIYVTNEMGLRDRIFFDIDTKNHTLQFSTVADTTHYPIAYQQPDSMTLILDGQMGKDSLSLTLLKQKTRDFLLVKHGFRWINEYPFNK